MTYWEDEGTVKRVAATQLVNATIDLCNQLGSCDRDGYKPHMDRIIADAERRLLRDYSHADWCWLLKLAGLPTIVDCDAVIERVWASQVDRRLAGEKALSELINQLEWESV